MRLFSANFSKKAVYIAPTRALCEERSRAWQGFSQFGIKTVLLTSDTSVQDLQRVKECNLIVSTPEKWDSYNRNESLAIELAMIDEIHTIKDGDRGGTLEVIITRLVKECRVVAVSATIPNVNDFCSWLNNGEPAVEFKFGDEYRPVPIEKRIVCYPNTTNEFLFTNSLKYRIPQLLSKYSSEKPTIIFCTTRKDTISTAEYLANEMESVFVNNFNQKTLSDVKLHDRKLAKLVQCGVGYHHAGLDPNDRQVIETTFLTGHLKVICATSTLAIGVNLPARLVIIKGTEIYEHGSGKRDYSDHDLEQMIGRAGRPQFDDHGVAIIMTTTEKQSKFNSFISGASTIESSLHLNLIEHLNAEIVLGNVRDELSALNWLKSTFLWVRIKCNPSYYRFNCDKEDAMLSAEHRLVSIFTKNVQELISIGIIKKHNLGFAATEYAVVMAKFYLKFGTIKAFLQLEKSPTEAVVFQTICKAEEFQSIHFRQDKTILNAIQIDPRIKFLGKKRISEPWEKVGIIIQMVLSDITIPPNAKTSYLHTESKVIMQNARRVARGLVPLVFLKEDYNLLYHATRLSRSIEIGFWYDSANQLRQIPGLGYQYSSLLEKSAIRTIYDLQNIEASKIELATGRNPPFGARISTSAKSLPMVKMEVITLSSPMAQYRVRLSILNKAKPFFNGSKLSFLFIAGCPDKLLHKQRFTVSQLASQREIVVTGLPKPIKFSFLCEHVIGLDVEEEVQSKLVEKVSNHESVQSSEYFISKDSNIVEKDPDYLWEGINDEDLTLISESSCLNNARNANADELVISAHGRQSNSLECNHRCRDKQLCFHLCCKIGLKNVSSRKYNKPSVTKNEPTDTTIVPKRKRKREIKKIKPFDDEYGELSDLVPSDDEKIISLNETTAKLAESKNQIVEESIFELIQIESQRSVLVDEKENENSSEIVEFGLDDDYPYVDIEESNIEKIEDIGKLLSDEQSSQIKNIDEPGTLPLQLKDNVSDTQSDSNNEIDSGTQSEIDNDIDHHPLLPSENVQFHREATNQSMEIVLSQSDVNILNSILEDYH